MPEKRFYLSCTRDSVGTNEEFWALDGGGYTTNLDKAHVYTLEEAQDKWNRARVIDVPVDADKVDALARYRVDFQYLPAKSKLTSEKEYVAYYRTNKDGNDVLWLTNKGCRGASYNFSDVTIFTKEQAIDELKDPESIVVFIPLSLAESVKRRTVDACTVQSNYKKLITASGLITPDYVKKHRRSRKRISTDKTRFNCPECGRTNWQYNPDDFEGCKYCDGHISVDWRFTNK